MKGFILIEVDGTDLLWDAVVASADLREDFPQGASGTVHSQVIDHGDHRFCELAAHSVVVS